MDSILNKLIVCLVLLGSSYGQTGLPLLGVGRTAAAGGQTWTTSTGWSAAGTTSGTITCTPACTAVTVPTVVAGDLLVMTFYDGTNAVKITSATGGGTWVVPAACTSGIAGAGNVSCAYVLSGTSGTSVTLTASASTSGAINVRSYHPSVSTAVAETVPSGTTSAGCSNNCNAPTVTLSGSSDVVLSVIATGNTSCSAASPFGNFTAPTGDGLADHLNTNSGTGATFTQGSSCPTAASGVAAMISIAFK